jgi:hypothetical protein
MDRASSDAIPYTELPGRDRLRPLTGGGLMSTDEDRGFWRTTTGLVTALAGLISALAAIIGIFVTMHNSDSPGQSTSEQQWVAAVSAECVQRNQDLNAALDDVNQATTIAQLKQTLNTLVSYTKNYVDGISRVPAPPEIQGRISGAINIEYRAVRELQDGLDALLAGNEASSQQSFQIFLNLVDRASSIFNDLGATACARL